MTTTRVFTEEDLLRAPQDGRKYELVDGEIRVSPAGARHGSISSKLGARLSSFVEDRRLGRIFDGQTGFRLPEVGEFLDAGTRLVWVIDPRQRTAAVYRSLTDVREIKEPGSLEGEDVLPGFSSPLAEILA